MNKRGSTGKAVFQIQYQFNIAGTLYPALGSVLGKKKDKVLTNLHQKIKCVLRILSKYVFRYYYKSVFHKDLLSSARNSQKQNTGTEK